uniref:DUF148 domain-containing protein n=1 Tax=Panagrellus redivivus TaxID=6233 RepID=A0A7E4VDX3_PANRE
MSHFRAQLSAKPPIMMRAAVLVLIVATAALAAPAPPPPVDQEAVADNVKKFSEMYRLATQLMNLGGKFLNQNGDTPSSSAVRSNSYNEDEDNGIFGNVVRPQLRPVPNYEPSGISSLFGGRSNSNGNRNPLGEYGGRSSFNEYGGSVGGRNPLSEYGGGPLGSGPGPVTPSRQTALDSILNTFLGSSFGGGGNSGASSGPSVTDIFSPSTEEYGGKNSRFGNSEQGSNIQNIIATLTRGGAQPAQPAGDGARSLFGFLG